MKKALKLIGFLIILFIVYSLISFAVGIVAGLAYFIISGVGSLNSTAIDNFIRNNVYIISLIADIIFVICLFVKRGSIKECRFKNISKKDYLYIALLSFGLAVILGILVALLMQIFPSYNEVAKTISSSTDSIFSLISIIVLIPICEEIIFRGVIFGYLKKRYNLVVSLIIQALAFAFMHGNIVQGIYTFILGLVLGIIYIYTNSLYGSMLMHIIYNLLGSVVLSKLYGAFPISVYICMILAVICIIYSTKKIKGNFKYRVKNS